MATSSRSTRSPRDTGSAVTLARLVRAAVEVLFRNNASENILHQPPRPSQHSAAFQGRSFFSCMKICESHPDLKFQRQTQQEQMHDLQADALMRAATTLLQDMATPDSESFARQIAQKTKQMPRFLKVE